MKRITTQLVLAGLLVTCNLLLVTSVSAQELKIGYVNLGKVFDGYDRTKASEAALEQRGKQKEGELEGRMNELKKLRLMLKWNRGRRLSPSSGWLTGNPMSRRSGPIGVFTRAPNPAPVLSEEA